MMLGLWGCKKTTPEQKGKIESEKLLSAIEKSDAANLFPIEHFKDRNKLLFFLNQLRNNCDFISRKGNFINDYYQEKDNYEIATYIYEYHLKCGDIRFLISYEIVKDRIELFGFNMESVKEDDKMITHPENRLWKAASNTNIPIDSQSH